MPVRRGGGMRRYPKVSPVLLSGSPLDSPPASLAEANRRLRHTPTISVVDEQVGIVIGLRFDALSGVLLTIIT